MLFPCKYVCVIRTVVSHNICSLQFYPGFAGSQVASTMFTFGTVAVLPFYTLMVVAPKAELVSFLSLSGNLSSPVHLSYFN